MVGMCDKRYDEKYSSISRIESDNEGWDYSFTGSSEMSSLIQRPLSKNLKKSEALSHEDIWEEHSRQRE